MTSLHNEILIDESIEQIWGILTDLERLQQYDPTVKSAHLTSAATTGIGASRRVAMLDGKNWFEEKVVTFDRNNVLAYQLTDCSFPILGLKHTYTFERVGTQTKVKQLMEYTVKFGLLGRIMDRLMIRKQTDGGVKKFMVGLKQHAESQ